MTNYSLLILSSGVTVVAFFAGFAAVHAWLRRRDRTRETLAMWVLICGAAVVTDLFISFGTFMPWQIPLGWLRRFSTDSWVPVAPHPAEYILAMFIAVVLYRSARQAYDQWDGLQSLEHHRRSQRGEHGSMISDGSSELLRVITRKPRIASYEPAIQQKSGSVLETVSETAAWKDEARELVRLSSSSYSFDASTDWHDAQGCWLGKNVNSADPVFLFPRHTAPTNDELGSFVAYSQKIASDRTAAEVEIIIAIENTPPLAVPLVDKFTRVVTRETLLGNLVNFTDYRNAIIRRTESQPLPDSHLGLRDVYVRSQFMRGDDVALGDADTYLRQWLDDPGLRQVAMLGGYGQGKSTTALMFTYQLLTAANWQQGRIPIFIELRGTSPRNLTPLQFLGAWAAQYNINPQALMKLHIAGRLLLIFEGFDEISLVGDAEMRLKHFRVLWQFCYARAKILITGRPNFFLDDEEMRLALGIHAPTVGRPYCDAVRIAPFTPDQIRESLRSHPDPVRNGIPPLVDSNRRFADLVSRPSLLHIVAVLWEKERLYEQLDKLNSAYVLELFVRHSYTRQGRKESHSPEFMALTTREREYFMQGIAAHMAANRMPNQIHASQLNQLIENLIENVPQGVSTTADALSGEVARPLNDRIAESEYGVEHVKTDVRACGLLVDDPAVPGTFRFGHKSFMEYIFASVVADRVVNDSPISRSVLRVADARINDILYLPVAVEFLSELIASKRASGVTSSRRNQERAFALQLLSASYDDSGLMLWLARYDLFNAAYVRSISDMQFWKRVAASIFAPLYVILLPIPILAFTFLYFHRADDLRLSYTMHMISATAIMLSCLYLIRSRQLWSQRASLGLWNLLCVRLMISDAVLHRIAGTYWLPWARRQKFVYFLPDFAVDRSLLSNASQKPVSAQTPRSTLPTDREARE